MNEHGKQSSPSPASPSTPVPTASARCKPFSPRALHRQLFIDAAIWWGYKGTLILILMFGLLRMSRGQDAAATLLGLFVAFMAGWFLYSLLSARTAQQLPRITELIEVHREEAEATLAAALRRFPLQRSIRLLLYHRLAVLQHQSKHFEETASICQTLLSYNLGHAQDVRSHLLLMLAESMLQRHDLMGAWRALIHLHWQRLNLIEALQVVGLQARYEVAAGHDAAALEGLENKIAMAELMPAPQCGAVHATLAQAARRIEHPRTQWLQRRTELLCTVEQLRSV